MAKVESKNFEICPEGQDPYEYDQNRDYEVVVEKMLEANLTDIDEKQTKIIEQFFKSHKIKCRIYDRTSLL